MTVFKIIADSNIFVAYALCIDRWHLKSKKIFKTDFVYCSKHIVNEFEKVLKERIKEVNKFIKVLISKLLMNNRRFNSLDDFNDFVMALDEIDFFKKNFHIRSVLRFFCERIFKLNFPINSFELYTAFEPLNDKFLFEINSNKINMYNQIKIFENHSLSYNLNISGIESMFHGKNKGGDYDIIHDICEYVELSKKNSVDSSFCFVTSDNGFYEGVKSILDKIPLDSVKHLKDIN